MGHDAIKLELIEWLSKLENEDTIQYLKIVKDADVQNQDWWNNLSETQIAGIKSGLKNIDEGRTISHEEVKLKYGL